MGRLPEILLALLLPLILSCASLRLAMLDPYPAGKALRGPEGSYELVPPSEMWVRVERNESQRNVDLALARRSADAWLNVSVVRDRYPTPASAIDRGRSRVEALMSVVSRDEQEVVVPSPDGELPARLGVYCGTFDRELRSRDSCFLILATVFQRMTYVVVGQVRVADSQPDAQDELTMFVRSLRIRPSKLE
jgi:hypothetical protein